MIVSNLIEIIMEYYHCRTNYSKEGGSDMDWIYKRGRTGCLELHIMTKNCDEKNELSDFYYFNYKLQATQNPLRCTKG